MIEKHDKSFKEEDTLRAETSFGSESGRKAPNEEETIVASVSVCLNSVPRALSRPELMS